MPPSRSIVPTSRSGHAPCGDAVSSQLPRTHYFAAGRGWISWSGGGYPAVVATNLKRGDEPAGESLDTGTTPASQQVAPRTGAIEPIACHEHPGSM